MAEHLIHPTQEDFQQTVLNSNLPVLVDFWAEWCGPCKMLAPVFERLAERYQGKVQFAKINVDAEGALAMTYRIMSIPALVLFIDGQPAERLVGLRSEEDIAAWLDEQIAN